MKIGVVGTSFIMETILDNINKTSGMECTSIYSRSHENAKVLMDKFNIQHFYSNYDEMCCSDNIDWIYIASPNSLHYEQAKKALNYGKNVLLEKPACVTVEQLKELKDIAVAKHLFFFEAIISMFHPNYHIVKELLNKIGNIKLGTGIFCQYSSRYDALLRGDIPNVFNPKFAGGALMDLNLYNIYFFTGLFGRPDTVTYRPEFYKLDNCSTIVETNMSEANKEDSCDSSYIEDNSNKIDTNGIVTLTYGNLRCECIGAKDAAGDNGVQIIGDKGYIKVTPSPSNVKKVELVLNKQEPVIYEVENNPWSYEMSGLVDIVKRKDYGACYKMIDTALIVCETLVRARKDGGLSF